MNIIPNSASFSIKENHIAVVHTPFGKIRISAEEYLTRIEFLTEEVPLCSPKTIFIQQIVDELNSYFKDPSFKFTIPYQMAGTDFQKRVWRALSALPIGTTISYGELAKKLNSGARAIGQACRTNPLPLVIPCHRVLSQHGLGGFSGDRAGKKIAIKQWLLNHEAMQAT